MTIKEDRENAMKSQAGHVGDTDVAIAVVEDFLAAVGRGEHDAAGKHLADEAVMIFPGGKRYSTLRELAEASASRYRWVDKHRTEYEAFTDANGDVVVWSMGTLFGENNAGVRYDGVRYVDRFRLRNGKIVEQRVWNDLEISGVLRARTPEEIDPRWRAADAAPSAPQPAPQATAVVRRTARATWEGRLRGGAGSLTLGSGATAPLPISLETRKRSDGVTATSPEELLAAAHAACFAMALRGALDAASPGGSAEGQAVDVTGRCVLRIDATGWVIDAIQLEVSARGVPRDVLDAALAVAERRCAISAVVRGNATVTVTVREEHDA